jgi:hypothetical protein
MEFCDECAGYHSVVGIGPSSRALVSVCVGTWSGVMTILDFSDVAPL